MNSRVPPIAVFLLTACPMVPCAAAAEGERGHAVPQVASAARHDTSPPLSQMPLRVPRPGADRRVPIRVPNLAERHKGALAAEDPVRQAEAGEAATPAPSLSFDGLSDDDNSAVLGFRIVPPDTNGDVGRRHYVQFINLILAVYDKTTGARVFGPVPGNHVWTGFGGICETNNDGDPIVLYDHLADRWVVSQFAIGADGHQCVAVSATADPTGAYHRYDFLVSPGGLNDYPKLGVWPDGYYMSVNEFARTVSGFSFNGVVTVAFERDRMLAGEPAQMVKFGPLPCGAECFFSLQPSHLEGPAPPAGTPNTFVMAWDDETFGSGINPDGYRLWDFAVSWASPGSSTFIALPQADAPEFDAELCQFLLQCIPQAPPGERLDALAGFTMYRAQHRSFRTHASLVLNHTVDVNGRSLAGIRWVELRRDGGGWLLHQTGTYAPADGNHRWMGSIAMDGSGDIALGFCVSGRTAFPSVRYVIRTEADPLGTLPGGEMELVAGAGAQRASFSRWGDYSSMSVDPVDDCTFWYTQEYYANTGTFDFKTRIGSFTVPGCVGAPGPQP